MRRLLAAVLALLVLAVPAAQAQQAAPDLDALVRKQEAGTLTPHEARLLNEARARDALTRDAFTLDPAQAPAPRPLAAKSSAALSEDFESTDLDAVPTGWAAFENATGITYDWVVDESGDGSNRFAFSRYSESGSTGEDYLVTPAVTVPTDGTLSFDAAQSFTSPFGSAYFVRVSTTSQTDASTFTTVASYTEDDFTTLFSTFTVDLSAYAGQSIFIAFVHENSFGDSFLLDNVVLDAPTPATVDFAETFFQFNNNDHADVEPGTRRAVIVGNVQVTGTTGTTPLTSLTFNTTGTTDPADIAFAAAYYTGSSTTLDFSTATQIGTDLASPSGAMTFTGNIDLPPGPNYVWLTYEITADATDDNLLDGTFESVTVDGTAITPDPTTLPGALQINNPPPITSYPYVVDFENGGVLPAGWTQETSPAGEEWQFTDGIGDGVGSDYGATEDHTTGTGFYAYLDDSTPSDAPTSLVTRTLDLSSLSVPRVSFWYQNAGGGTEATSPISELRIDLSTDGGTTFDPADQDLLVITQRIDDWTQFTADLSAYAGESSVAVRFRGVETDNFRSNPALDDVVVEETPTVGEIAISPNTGAFGTVSTTDAGAFVQTYTVTNTGAGTLTVEQPTTSGADAGTFLIGNASETFPVGLGAGGTVSFDLTLDTPVAIGTYAADLEVPYDLGDGSGTQTETIALTLTVNDPNFGGGGPGTGGYFFANSTPGAAGSPSQPSVRTVTIASGETDITADLGDDSVTGPITLPFAFRFFDADYTEVWLSSNGWLSFTDPAAMNGNDRFNTAIPTAGATENLIAWFWDDLNPTDPDPGSTSIRYGQDAEGRFVLLLERVPEFGADADGFITASVTLEAGADASTNGSIRIQYEEIGSTLDTSGSTIGIENADGTLGVQYLFDGTGGPIQDDDGTGLKAPTPMALAFAPSTALLPVELAAFDAVAASEQEVDLAWQTASETNNAGFYVEHRRLAADGTASADGTPAAAEWSDLGFVEGTGTTTEAQSYRFRATGLAPGRHAFRLRQIDFDGTPSLSEEIETDLQLRGPYALSGAYPNPFTERTQLDVTVRETQRVTVTVYDVLGRRVATAYDGMVEGSESVTVTFSARGLASGVYFYRVQGERFRATERMTLVR